MVGQQQTRNDLMRLGAARLGSLAAVALLSSVGSGAFLTHPSLAGAEPPPIVGSDEHAATLAALAPPKRSRPIIAVIGSNEGTETTDYLVPYGVLKRADVADVVALGTEDGPITLMPALEIVPDASTADFDGRHPAGADYVIVPAMHDPDDPATVAWVKDQAQKGAIIVGVCAGAGVLGNAGLLDARKATTHWYDLDGIRDDNPTMHYVPDRRYLVDRGVVTTTGVTASIPVSLVLIEAIAGHARAVEVATELGVEDWDARHDSGAFRSTSKFYATAIGNMLAFWRHEDVGISVESGIDEVALALTADAWSRTYRSSALTVAKDRRPVTMRSGLVLVPDRVASESKVEAMLPPVASDHPARALDKALNDIADRYGGGTKSFVALQLEYPVPEAAD